VEKFMILPLSFNLGFVDFEQCEANFALLRGNFELTGTYRDQILKIGHP
jgi:hypothetical protein